MKDSGELKYYTYELDMVYLNFLAIVLCIIVGGIVFFIEKDDGYLLENFMSSQGSQHAFLLIFMILWLLLHEVIHGIGFSLFKEVKNKNIVFGAVLEKGVFYCMCKQKISRKVIITSLLFPFIFLGVITLILAMIINSYTLVVLSIINIGGAVGDLVMTYYFLRAPKDIVYLDLDDCTSFTVLSNSNLCDLNIKGVKLKDTGRYNEKKMVAHDKRKLVISKASYVCLGVLLLIASLMFFLGR